MGVKKYEKNGVTLWKIDTWLIRPDGTLFRFRQSRILTKEQALVLEAKKRADCLEGRFFDRRKEERHTVAELWKRYQPITTRDNHSYLSDYNRAEHLCRQRAVPTTGATCGRWRSSTLILRAGA